MVRAGLVLVLLLSMVAGAGCSEGGDAEPPYPVSSTVVSHETTQEISVFAPEAEGSWPVAYLLHCYDCNREDSAEMGRQLASHGVVAFVPDYRSTHPLRMGGYLEKDLECGYRYARSIAHEYGGDLDQPVTFVGDSFGSTVALGVGTSESYFGPTGEYDTCFAGTPRADVVVAIGGCYYEYEGEPVYNHVESMVEHAEGRLWDGKLVFVVGESDDICHAWQSEGVVAALQAAGYDAELHVMAGGDHHNVVFWTQNDGEWITVPDDPVGKQVLQLILDRIEAATP
jgi:acetyl esterase/lipase